MGVGGPRKPPTTFRLGDEVNLPVSRGEIYGKMPDLRFLAMIVAAWIKEQGWSWASLARKMSSPPRYCGRAGPLREYGQKLSRGLVL